MSLPLPNLDDRRWAELVDQGRTLIPVHAPSWTDHNVHDPGITMIELLAWIAEMDIYRANRVPASHRRKFLELVGFAPTPPTGARTLIGFELVEGAPATMLPAGVDIGSTGAQDPGSTFHTDRRLLLVPGRVAAVQVMSRGDFEDLTSSWLRGEPLPALGSDPAPGSALYLGLSAPLPVGSPAALYFDVDGGGREERLRLLAQAQTERAACQPPDPGIDCLPCHCGSSKADSEVAEPEPESDPIALPAHHSARLTWEIAVAPGVWRRLVPASGEVVDGTRSLTLTGAVELELPAAMAPVQLGEVAEPLHYLRVRQAGGAFDAPPRLNAVQLNGVEARQEVSIRTEWLLAPAATVSGPVPAAGEQIGISFGVNDDGEIDTLEFMDAAPRFRVLGYQEPAPTSEGRLLLEAALLGVGSGKPEQSFELPQGLVAGKSLEVFSLEGGSWREWSERPDWTRSSRKDAHFLLDPIEAEIGLGDGEAGRVLPRNAFLVAAYEATGGADGDRAAGSLDAIADNAHNRAVVPDFDLLTARLGTVTQPLTAAGGSAGESLAETAARALEDLETPQRAVNLEDIERLASQTPGARPARVFAIANLHPAFPCVRAAGVVTVVVLPSLPSHRPEPSRGLRRQIGAYLAARRVLGTRFDVVGPEYVELTVRARVRACPLVDLQALRRRLIESLDAFFHPLTGGPQGQGWPFGRDVYRSEVLQVLDDTDGADHVLSLEFIRGDCTAVCGNVCLPPTGLVASGEHEIEVV